MAAPTSTDFGPLGDARAELFRLEGSSVRASVSNFGACLVDLETPDRSGTLDSVVLGFSDAESYRRHHFYFGATVGRCANRIGDSSFELEGERYAVAPNDPPHHLHGGPGGFDQVLWEAQQRSPREVIFSRISPDGEEGYPGAVRASVCYRVEEPGTLVIEMTGEADRPTVLNLAHHSYFNLGGASSPNILEHELRLFADAFTPEVPIPHGKVAPVAGTPFDFVSAKPVGRDLAQVSPASAGGPPPGYDHNFVVRGDASVMRPVAELHEPRSGRTMAISANAPGVQFYCGKFLPRGVLARGRVLEPYAGLCLETQAFPNAVNVPAWRPQVVLLPGARYEHHMRLSFGVRRG